MEAIVFDDVPIIPGVCSSQVMERNNFIWVLMSASIITTDGHELIMLM